MKDVKIGSFPEFIESPIECKSVVLKNFNDKLLAKGFRFHPGKVCEHINKEVERQFAELCAQCFNGVSIDKLQGAQEETFSWLESEDVRYADWKKAKADHELLMSMPPVEIEKIVPITKNKKK